MENIIVKKGSPSDSGMLSLQWMMSRWKWNVEIGWHSVDQRSRYSSVDIERYGTEVDSDASNSEWSMKNINIKWVTCCNSLSIKCLHGHSRPTDCWSISICQTKLFVSSTCCPERVNQDASACAAVIRDRLCRRPPSSSYETNIDTVCRRRAQNPSSWCTLLWGRGRRRAPGTLETCVAQS